MYVKTASLATLGVFATKAAALDNGFGRTPPMGFNTYNPSAMVWLKSRYLACWSKYNYVLSASWSAAIGISAIIIFFSVQYSGKVSVNWWGNEVSYQGCEDTACTRLTLPKGEFFGPRSW